MRYRGKCHVTFFNDCTRTIEHVVDAEDELFIAASNVDPKNAELITHLLKTMSSPAHK